MNGTQGTSTGKTAANGASQLKSFILGTVGELKECRPSPESVTDLWASSGLFLKPVTKVSITVTIPFVKGKEGSRVVSNNEVIANIKKLVTPREFLTLKISKETNTFLRYIGEIEEKKDLPIFVSKLNGSFIQLKSFGNDAVFKLNAAEYDVIVPKQKDWVNHFAKMIGSDEDKPGMRPDTLVITGLPCAWFSNYHKDKQRTLKEFERKRNDRKKRKMIKNRRRQRGSSVSSSTGDEEGFDSSSTDSAEEEERRKREQQKKILLQFQTGDYQNTEEGKSFVHTKNEVHKILRVDPKSEGTTGKEKYRRTKSNSESRSSSSRSSYSRSRSDSKSRSRSYSSSSGSRKSISSRSSASGSSYRRKSRNKRRRRNPLSEKKKSVPKKPAANMWKKNTFTNVEEPADTNHENLQNGDAINANEKDKGVERLTRNTEEMKSKEAKRKARKEFKKRPWINLPIPEVPEESMLRRVFELFGRVRKIEVPLLKEVADQNSKYKKRSNSVGIGVFNFETFAAQSEAANVTSFKTFVVYIQYETYLGFTVAMNALRGKRLYYKDLDDRAYICTFKVDFDGNGYLSDRKIKQRKVERFKLLHKDEIENDEQQPSSNKKGRRDSSRKRNSVSSKRVYAPEAKAIVADSRAKAQDSKTRHAFRGAEYFNEDGSQVSRKRKSVSKYGPNALRRKRDKIAFPMPDKVLPKSILHEKSESQFRITKSLSFVGPELPQEKSRDEGKDEDARRRDLSEFSDISSEEEEDDEPNGLESNTEIDRLLKEALKVKNGRKRRLVVLELLRRLQAAKESRVYLVAKRKAQAVILIHAIFERIKNAENVIMERHVEMLEEVRRKQIEQEKSLKEEFARKEALRALKQHQKLQSKEVKLREKMVKRAMRCKDKEDLERREKLRKQVAAATLAAHEAGEDVEENPLVIKSTALREARHSVRRHGFKPDMVGHLEDKAVGYTAPENYINYVEYMKEKRPNFVGSAVVTSFSVVEETPQRADVIRSCVVPKQAPVPATLEEIIKNKQFQTDSESSCDEMEPPPPPVPVVEPRKISYARTHLAFIKSGNRKDKRPKRSGIEEPETQIENDSEGFKVPQLPAAYRTNENDTTTTPVESEGKGSDEIRSNSFGSLSEGSSENEMQLEPGETNPENGKSDNGNVDNPKVDDENINNHNNKEVINDLRSEKLEETTKSEEKTRSDPPQKRRNAVEDSIMDDVNKMGYSLTTGIDAGRSTDTQTLSGLESQSDNEEGKSWKNDATQKRSSDANDSSDGEYSGDESSGSYDGSTSASEEGEVSDDENHGRNSSVCGGRDQKCSEKTVAELPEPAVESENTIQPKTIIEDVLPKDLTPEPDNSQNNSTNDKIFQRENALEVKREASDVEPVDISSESGSGDESYSGSYSESGSFSESEGEIDE